MKIIGLKIEKYIGQSVSGHNCNFEYTDMEFVKHIIFGILSNNKKVAISLYHSEGECGSGWTCASWGHIDVEEVKTFGGYTYTPKKEIIVDDIFPGADKDYYNNKVFEVSYDGGDSYYPSGDYTIDMKLFDKTPRAKEKRPIWIFRGKSNVGKSFIGSHISNLDVYETDSSPSLPQNINASVIILGNKYKFKIDDIKNRITGDFELCFVNFTIEKPKTIVQDVQPIGDLIPISNIKEDHNGFIEL